MTKWKRVFVSVFIFSLVLFLAPIPSGASGGWGLDKLAHLLIFSALFFSGSRAYKPGIVLLAAALIFYGLLIEFLQLYIFTYRNFNLLDVAFDFLGLAVGILIIKYAKNGLGKTC